MSPPGPRRGIAGALFPHLLPPRTWRAEKELEKPSVTSGLLDTLTHARRVYLHREIAEAIERLSEGERQGRERHAEVLAFHHESAGQLDRVLPFLLAAGERAQKRLGFTEAIAVSAG